MENAKKAKEAERRKAQKKARQERMKVCQSILNCLIACPVFVQLQIQFN